jgi:hypothetical protein
LHVWPGQCPSSRLRWRWPFDLVDLRRVGNHLDELLPERASLGFFGQGAQPQVRCPPIWEDERWRAEDAVALDSFFMVACERGKRCLLEGAIERVEIEFRSPSCFKNRFRIG